jgi:hypothetical protein
MTAQTQHLTPPNCKKTLIFLVLKRKFRLDSGSVGQ